MREEQARGDLREDVPAEKIAGFVSIVANGIAVQLGSGEPIRDVDTLVAFVRSAIAPSDHLSSSGYAFAYTPLDLLDLVDVCPRLRECNAATVRQPPVDVPLTRVIGGEREPQVTVVPPAQVVEVPRAVADVDLRVAEIRDDEPRPAGADRDALAVSGSTA